MTLRYACAAAEDWLPQLPPGQAACLLTDPPYSSGGMFRGDRAQPTGRKYTATKTQRRGNARADFGGDTRDQRAYLTWTALWLRAALPALAPGAVVALWTDWRQLPTVTDAIQIAGLTWRGIVPWDKGRGARMAAPGRWPNQCEYLAWGTAGPAPRRRLGFRPAGCLHEPTLPAERAWHQTPKPVAGLTELLRIVPPGATVLDPFAGTAPIALACAALGLAYAGAEIDPAIHADGCRRLTAAGLTLLTDA